MKMLKTATGYRFWCPGCKDTHEFWTDKPGGFNWSFNGNVDKPTFSPSLLIRTGHYATGHKPGESCWCTYNAEHPDKKSPFECGVCHLFLESGMLKFLSDCTHPLAGQTVELPNLPEKFT